MTLEEAQLALSERQGVCSPAKFIERYGEEEGLKRQLEWRKKWKDTNDAKSDQEKLEINRSKRALTNFTYRDYFDEDQEAHLYFVKLRCLLSGTTFYKIGATTKEHTIDRFNYDKYDIEVLDVLAESPRYKVRYIGEKEGKIHSILKNKFGNFNLGRTFDGWTECYALSENQVKNVKKSISKIGLN